MGAVPDRPQDVIAAGGWIDQLGESVSVKRQLVGGSAREAHNNGWKVAAGFAWGARQRMKSDLDKLV